MFSKGSFIFAVACLYLTGCASGAFKARQEQREKLVGSSGLYCEFVNGEQHPDIDVELNMQMAKRCDASKPFSITNYKTSSEMNGVMYCCQVPGSAKIKVSSAAPVSASAAKATSGSSTSAAKALSSIAKPEMGPAKGPAIEIESEDAIVGE